ncbi:hypothetical protein [Aliihoeflea sp. PC F10.4]
METGQLNTVDDSRLAQGDNDFLDLIKRDIITSQARYIVRPIVKLGTSRDNSVLLCKRQDAFLGGQFSGVTNSVCHDNPQYFLSVNLAYAGTGIECRAPTTKGRAA